MDLIQKFHLLVEQKQAINEQLKSMEKDYIEQFVKSTGLNAGDLVKCPDGTVGFLRFSDFLKFDKIEFWLKAVKKDGTESLNNVSCWCKFESLVLIKKATHV